MKHLKMILLNVFYSMAGRTLENILSSGAIVCGVLWGALMGSEPTIGATYEVPWSVWNPPSQHFKSCKVSALNAQGDSTDFEIFVLSQEFGWVKGESDEVQIEGDPRSLHDIRETIDRFKKLDRVRRMNDIVFIGLASCEGDPQKEVDRAGQRAAQLADWFGVPHVRDQKIYTLNLGQFDVTRCAEFTTEKELARQRPIIALGVERMSAKLDEVAIRTALKSNDVVSINAEEYSAFRDFRLRAHR